MGELPVHSSTCVAAVGLSVCLLVCSPCVAALQNNTAAGLLPHLFNLKGKCSTWQLSYMSRSGTLQNPLPSLCRAAQVL